MLQVLEKEGTGKPYVHGGDGIRLTLSRRHGIRLKLSRRDGIRLKLSRRDGVCEERGVFWFQMDRKQSH